MAIRKGKFNKHQLGLFFLLDACQRNAAGWSTAVWPANAKLPLPHRRSSITRPCCSIERSSAKLLVFTCTSKFERSTGSESEHVDALGLRAVEVIICMITRDFSVISMTSQASLSLCLSQKSLTHNIGSASALPIIGESLTAKTCMIVINSTLGWRICENSVGEEVECLLVQFHAWYTEIAKWELSWCMKLYSKSQRWVHSNAKHIIMNRMRRPSCLISVTLLFLFEFLEMAIFLTAAGGGDLLAALKGARLKKAAETDGEPKKGGGGKPFTGYFLSNCSFPVHIAPFSDLYMFFILGIDCSCHIWAGFADAGGMSSVLEQLKQGRKLRSVSALDREKSKFSKKLYALV